MKATPFRVPEKVAERLQGNTSATDEQLAEKGLSRSDFGPPDDPFSPADDLGF